MGGKIKDKLKITKIMFTIFILNLKSASGIIIKCLVFLIDWQESEL
jgi:uncharacterized membrane protein YGL010W